MPDCMYARLYTVGWPTLSSHLDSSKNDNGERWIIPFMKSSRLRVKEIQGFKNGEKKLMYYANPAG